MFVDEMVAILDEFLAEADPSQKRHSVHPV
jgi:hypothetical protein